MHNTMLDYAFFEGHIIPFTEANISIGTHCVQYGTGAFAGIRGYLDDSGETVNIVRLPDHARRLLNSARLLRADLPYDQDDICRIIIELAERNAHHGDIYIRPFIYKSAVQLAPRLKGLGDEFAVYMLPIGDYLKLDQGQRAIVSSWFRIPDNAIPSRGKLSGAYVNSAFAKDEAEEKGADEAIMLNTAGKIAEGSACNLFIVRNGVLTTPPFSSDILEGITRRSVIQIASDSGIEIEVREIDRTELYLAEEAFFCGTGAQIAWIESIDGRPVGNGTRGPITQHLQDAFFDAVRGRSTKYSDWLTRVRIPVSAGVA
ncbi:branched-chain amino acid transaminase [soil metagenome]